MSIHQIHLNVFHAKSTLFRMKLETNEIVAHV